MVAYYKAVLGARASYENDQVAFLTYDDEHHRIAIARFPDAGKNIYGSAGLDHVAFTYNNIHDLLTAYKQRKARGIVPSWSVNHGPTISLYYMDPDGNKVETQVDVFETMEEGKRFSHHTRVCGESNWSGHRPGGPHHVAWRLASLRGKS